MKAWWDDGALKQLILMYIDYNSRTGNAWFEACCARRTIQQQ
jgi:hypothetical protein